MMMKNRFATKTIPLFICVALLSLLCAWPSFADHEQRRRHRHDRQDRNSEWPAVGGPRTPSLYAEIEAGVSAIPDAIVHGPFVDGEIDLDAGFVTGGAIGAQITPFLRIEGAMSYREAQIDSFVVEGFVTPEEGSFGAFTTFANGYFDLAIPGSPVTPFIGGGVGLAVVHLDTFDPFELVHVDDESLQFAWNLSAGASWHLSQNIDLITRYRYVATEDLDEDYKDGTLKLGEADFELDAHEAVVGVRFRF